MSPDSLDFATLNHAANAEAWNNTFAYWLLVLHDSTSTYAQKADDANAAMSFQLDVEEQAQNVEGVAGEAALIPRVFVPIAPVTLALHWSPFPAALRALGPPVHSHTHQGRVLAAFTPLLGFDADGDTADEQHFTFLLRVACVRAVEAGALVLMAGSPGWSYNDVDYLAEQPETQQLMRDFGFAYTLRKPPTAY